MNKNKKVKYPVSISLLPVLSMIVAILPSIFHNTAGIDIAKIGIITIVLTGTVSFYIRLNADNILDKTLAKTIIILGYLGSICLLLLVPEPTVYSLWMIGGLLVAMLLDNKLGLLLNFNLTFIMGIMLNLHPENVIQILVICLLMSLLAGALKNKVTVIYAVIIILSSNITLAFAINNFVFERASNYNYVYSLFSILAVLITAFFISIPYQNFINKAITKDSAENNAEICITSNEEDNTSDSIHSSMEEKDNQKAKHNLLEKDKIVLSIQESALTSDLERDDLPHSVETKTSFEVLCDMDNQLIRELKQYSEILYLHAVHIGDLSYLAAMEIGANELLAKAGGLYHEIGKINGKNYIEESLKLAEDYSFPKELKAILREHNIKYEKPSSVEAAIVMLSDNVASTIEYIEKTEDHKYTTNKIIENIFQMRLDKGTFDASGLSLIDYKKLKEFYQSEFNKTKSE